MSQAQEFQHKCPGKQPSVSIITAARNAAATLSATVKSVQEQDYRHLQHVVVDGDSEDDTLEVLNRHQHSSMCFSSEPDSGIAEAINKGLRLSSGEWVLFLHADEQLASPSIVSEVVPHLNTDAEIAAFRFSLETLPGRLSTFDRAMRISG